MKITALAGAMLTALMLAGCISTQEMPLAPNVVRLDTQSKGLLFTGQTVPQTMRAAAKATLDRGYTHFKLAEAGVSQGSEVAGVVGSSNSNFNGSYGYGSMSGNSSSFGTASVVRAPTANAAATVVMFHANEPGARGAFEAEQVLKQYSQ
jgi:outer membrane murein-binding lipoprotein Lpp